MATLGTEESGRYDEVGVQYDTFFGGWVVAVFFILQNTCFIM